MKNTSRTPLPPKQESTNIIRLLKQAQGQPLGKFPIPPFTKWLNGTIRDVKRGFIAIEYDTRSEMANPMNILHGGAQAAMIDDSIGIACATLGYKNFMITIDCRLDFLGRVPIGSKVLIKARVVREGKNIIHAEARSYLADDSLVAVAQSNLLHIDTKPDYVKSSTYDTKNLNKIQDS